MKCIYQIQNAKKHKANTKHFWQTARSNVLTLCAKYIEFILQRKKIGGGGGGFDPIDLFHNDVNRGKVNNAITACDASREILATISSAMILHET